MRCDARSGSYCCTKSRGHLGPHIGDAPDGIHPTTKVWGDPEWVRRAKERMLPTKVWALS